MSYTEALQQSHWASKGDCKLKKTRYPKLRNSVLFYGEVQESGLTEIIPLIYISALWGQYPVFPHPEFPGGSPWGVAAVWKPQDGRRSPMAARWQVFAPSRAPSELTSSPSTVAVIAEHCDAPHILIWKKHSISHVQHDALICLMKWLLWSS